MDTPCFFTFTQKSRATRTKGSIDMAPQASKGDAGARRGYVELAPRWHDAGVDPRGEGLDPENAAGGPIIHAGLDLTSHQRLRRNR